ncbi:ABC transporter ATP-binding protein [Paenibacillus sp. CGMCC 1.16610]|uniref:ATP-binding cassette domain-containing protein n=1 Tax=Paenibacillus anseongense TaxID=2682845 RepID=A0ABW9UAE8_9BACL|nr:MULTISPECIES: ABC transporter ATP-binding protein [Paenibacillus]MBA2938055.1 ABC transporter ATP-binding protein [Paenibacillus sp. CGMCC 1.16610]MVQ37112.1 ATP-binding cassette domain-containing protein [Paenibacillus anseongense]
MSDQPRNRQRPPSQGVNPAHFGRGGMGAMGMPVQKAKDFKGTLRRLSGYMKPFRVSIISVFIAAVLSTVFSIISPKLMGNATTKLYEGSMAKFKGVPGAKIDFDALLQIVLILAALYVFSSVLTFIQQRIMVGVTQKIVFNLRKDISDKLTRVPLSFFDSRSHGDTMSRATNDVDTISSTMQQSLTQLITSIVTLLGIIIMMLTISPLLTLVTIITLPLSILATKMIASRSQKYFKGQQKTLGELNGHVEEMYTGHTIVKAFGRERHSIEKFNEINDRLYHSGWKAQFISGMIFPLMSFIGNIGYVLVSVIGGIMVTQSTIKIGDILAFIQYSGQFGMPITQVANIANIIQSTIAAAERIFELLDEPEEVLEDAASKSVTQVRGHVQFNEVAFSYKTDEPLIEHMNIEVEPGQTVAIVGPTGAGKTTIVNLLMRFYELKGGTISIDGVDSRKMSRSHLRGLFGMVLQDTWLFNGTIRENIAYGRDGASEEEIVNAARAAYADHFIRTLPDGYNTILNEEASNLSHGQKQLLTIARAILADPAILILDEATSSVDTRTEVSIQRAMNNLMENRTSFVIAHRLSTIRDADLILVMNHGTVIEQGTHEQLLAQNGFYADLYNSQFASKAIS